MGTQAVNLNLRLTLPQMKVQGKEDVLPGEELLHTKHPSVCSVLQTVGMCLAGRSAFPSSISSISWLC